MFDVSIQDNKRIVRHSDQIIKSGNSFDFPSTSFVKTVEEDVANNGENNVTDNEMVSTVVSSGRYNLRPRKKD